jgi:hypothetical protein
MLRIRIRIGIHGHAAYPHARRRAHDTASDFPPICDQDLAKHQRPLGKLRGHKSLFASFSSEKEDSSFFEKKEAKKRQLRVLSIVTLTF